MLKDIANREQISSWHPGGQWWHQRLEVGREYILWPKDRRIKHNRGRLCVFLGFVQAGYRGGIGANVRCADNDQKEVVSPSDLIPAYFSPSQGKNGDQG